MRWFAITSKLTGSISVIETFLDAAPLDSAQRDDDSARSKIEAAYESNALTMQTHSASSASRHTGLPARLYQ